MTQSLIQELIDRSLDRQISFKEIVERLHGDGVESYHVDFLRHENRYYSTAGETAVHKVNLPSHPVAMNFSVEGMRSAIRQAQKGEMFYPEFAQAAAAAGCAYYIVSMPGAKVTYIGRDGGQHVEHFPNRN